MKKYIYKNMSKSEKSNLIKRNALQDESVTSSTKVIVNDVKQNGLKAALKYARKFDALTEENILLTKDDLAKADELIDEKVKRAIDKAAVNIQKFHELQFPKNYSVETIPGVICSREFRAIENVGLYVPGGTAVLPSTMLMLGIPASIAGCRRKVVCSPSSSRDVNPALLYAAHICNVDEFYILGGAQAIALMAYGSGEFEKVDKIFGPGNQFVTNAKMIVSQDPDGCSIDMPAGPSEVLIIADDSADSAFVAADMLSQLEHGNDSQAILVTNSSNLIVNVERDLLKQTDKLERKEFIKSSVKNSFILLVDDLNEAFEFSNNFAPEHLILNIEQADKYSDKVINAGSVFLGKYSPESAGDYASGTNHSLPTYGFAKSIGGVTVESFMKSISFQELTKEGLSNIADSVITLAETEKLQAHAAAVKVRL